jgi:hypothetical protein
MDMTQAAMNPNSHIQKHASVPLLVEDRFGRMPGFQEHMEGLLLPAAVVEKENEL